jgi:hypothetical protein
MASGTAAVDSVAPMTPMRLRPAVVLAAFTLLVWTTRIRNIWTDDTLSTAGQVGRTVLSLTFTAFAVAVLWLWWQGRRRSSADPIAGPVVRTFAAWTVGVWAVRAVQIASAGHDAAFVAVHTALAVVSTALAVRAVRDVRRGPDRRSSPRRVSSSS